MRRAKRQPPTNWIARVKEAVETARDRLEESERIIEAAEKNLDPIIDPLQLAKFLYGLRRSRGSFFPADLFAEPGWDLLLDLYIARREGGIVTTTAASVAACVPYSTGYKWIEKMADQGILYLSRSPSDKRLTLVALTDAAVQQMDDLLSHAASQLPFNRLTCQSEGWP